MTDNRLPLEACRKLAAAIVGQAVFDRLSGFHSASFVDARMWLKSPQADRLMEYASCDQEAFLSRLSHMNYVERKMWKWDWRNRNRERRDRTPARERTRKEKRACNRERLAQEERDL